VGANPLVRGMLFDVDPLDAPTMIGAALLLVAAAALASYLPVRRATRVGNGNASEPVGETDEPLSIVPLLLDTTFAWSDLR
jgi:hypothetical protein